jgi:hypothetical protein
VNAYASAWLGLNHVRLKQTQLADIYCDLYLLPFGVPDVDAKPDCRVITHFNFKLELN